MIQFRREEGSLWHDIDDQSFTHALLRKGMMGTVLAVFDEDDHSGTRPWMYIMLDNGEIGYYVVSSDWTNDTTWFSK